MNNIYISCLKDEARKDNTLFIIEIEKNVLKRLNATREDRFIFLIGNKQGILVKSENGHPLKKVKGKNSYELSFYDKKGKFEENIHKECIYFVKNSHIRILM